MDIGLTGMENALRKIRMVDKIRKVLSLQTKSSVESVICTTLCEQLAILGTAFQFYLSPHPTSWKEVSGVKLNAWLVRENFHRPLLCFILHNTHKAQFVFKVSKITNPY